MKRKPPTNSTTSKPGYLSRTKILTLAAALIVPAASGFAATLWTDGTADFNNPSDWNGTYIDSGGDSSPNPTCANNEGSNNVVLIEPNDPIWYHGGTLAGSVASTSGAYLQTGSTNDTGYPVNNNNLRLGELAGSYGSYVLSNGAVNVTGYLSVGEAGTGYLEVDGGALITGYMNDPGLVAGYGDINGAGGIGTMVLTSGTVSNVQETWFGEESGCTGYFTMSGGTFNAHNWFVLGRNGGVGYGTMTGGTINFTGGGQFLVGGGGIGSLFQSGGTINVYNQYLVPQSGNSTDVGTNILSGTAVLNVHDWLAVGRSGGSGVLDVSNGASITRDNADGDSGGNFDVGASGLGVLNQNGGAITNLAGNTWIGESGNGTWNLNSGVASLGSVVMAVNSSATSTLNLNGGLLQVSGIQVGNNTPVTVINFGGGTLQATANNANFMSGLTYALLNSGGVVIDSQGNTITIPQEIDDGSGGPLVKIGSGTLTLSGPNTYSDNTTVNAGTLIAYTGSGANGNYIVADNAAFGVSVQALNQQLDQANLTVGSSAGAALDFNLGSFGNPASAPLNVGGTFTANGTITVNVTDGLWQLGQFPLIQFPSGGLAGSGTFVLGTLPSGVAANLVVTSTSVSLDVTGVNLPRWEGLAGGAWDIGLTTNWINLGTGLPTYYDDGNVVLFNDSALGTTNVNITTTVSPSSMTVNNNALDYTFYGVGSISGSTGLSKQGTNTLAILNAPNSYTGPTTISGGTLIVSNLANGGSPSAIGASSAGLTNLLLAGGTLDYIGPSVSINRGYTEENTNGTVDISIVSNLTLSGSVADIAGSGCIVSGPGQLIYANSGLNTLSDVLGYSVDEGTVAFSGSGTDDISGSLDVGSSSSVASMLDITNSATVNLLTGGDFDVADSHANGTTNIGIINQSGGVLNVAGGYQTWIGQATYGMGTYNLGGGTFNANNWVAIGRANGVGTFNLSGSGALNIVNGNGGNLDIGTSAGIGGDVGTGVLNQTGGTVSNTASETWLGEGASGEPASGTWNMSGGTAQLGELHIGVGGTGTSTLNISGSASITESYLLLANYDPNTTGNVNVGSASQPGGTITVNADMNVGGAGAGTLNFVTNGGGMVTVTGTLYLSRFNPTADGTVNLNAGGTLVVSYINNGWAFNEGTNSPTFNPNTFNFNGGTLRAFVGSQSFIQPNVNAVVQSGGAIIDDGGYSVWAECTFNDAPGNTAGLTKMGSGTLNLTATNTYTGTTVVSNGTLIANSLAGGITVEPGATLLAANAVAGPVSVASGGTLGGNIGTIGTNYFNNTLTLASGSTTFVQLTPSSNDQIAGLTGVTYGGSLIVSNISLSPLTVGSQFQLFHSSSAGTGNFSSVTILPLGAGTFNPATGILTITSNGAPKLSTPHISSGNLILTGTGGSANGNYQVLSATNLLIPIPNWITNTTGTFSGAGTFTNSIPIGNLPAQYFMLKTP